jgi:hypothetical protein
MKIKLKLLILFLIFLTYILFKMCLYIMNDSSETGMGGGISVICC